MPRPSNTKNNARARAALARSSRTSPISSRNSTRPSTPYRDDESSVLTSANNTPPMSPMPPDPSDVFSDEESEGFEEIEIKITAPEDSDLPNELITTEKSIWESPEDEDGYRSEDDLSELEGEELEESLLRQKQAEDGLMEHLMRSIGAKEWKKAESNRHLGYGNKSSDRTQRWRRQKKREKEDKDEKSRNS